MMSKVVSSEIVKYKRTWLWILPLIIPFIIVLANGLNIFLRYDTIVQQAAKDGMTMWDPIWIFSFFLILLAVPLEVTLITSIIANIEHQGNSWKSIFSMPVSRFQIYVNKFAWSTVLTIISGFILMIGIIILGMMVGNDTFPWTQILGFSLFPFLTAVPLIALQLWLALTFPNQAIPITIGSLGILLTILGGQLPLGKWLPWTFYVQVLPSPNQESVGLPWDIVGTSFIIGLLLLFVGFIHFRKKEFA